MSPEMRPKSLGTFEKRAPGHQAATDLAEYQREKTFLTREFYKTNHNRAAMILPNRNVLCHN